MIISLCELFVLCVVLCYYVWDSWDAVDGVKLQTVGCRSFEDRAHWQRCGRGWGATCQPLIRRPRAASSPRLMAPAPEDQSRHSSRDGPVHCGQTRESIGGDGRCPRSCRGRSQVRADESQVSVEATASGRRNRSVPQKHRQRRDASRSWIPSAHRSVLCSQRPRSASRDR